MKIINYILDDNTNLKQVSIEAIIKFIKNPDTQSHNNVRFVEINGIKGYLKDSKDSMPTFDKFEFLISKLGQMLGIKMADEYLVLNDSKIYIFSKSVIKDNEKLIMMSNMNDEILIKNGISKEMIERLRLGENFDLLSKEYNISDEAKKIYGELFEEVFQIKEYRKKLDAIDSTKGKEKFKINDEDIEFAINIFIKRIKKLNLPNEEEIIKEYIKMCFLDALIGNKDRNVNNYGLIKYEDNTYSFAPLFDSSTIVMPNVDNDLWQLNEFNMNRLATLKLLLNKFSNYLEEIFEIDIEKVKNIMTLISKEVLDSSQQTINEFDWFDKEVISKIDFNTLKNISVLK